VDNLVQWLIWKALGARQLAIWLPHLDWKDNLDQKVPVGLPLIKWVRLHLDRKVLLVWLMGLWVPRLDRKMTVEWAPLVTLSVGQLVIQELRRHLMLLMPLSVLQWTELLLKVERLALMQVPEPQMMELGLQDQKKL